MVSWSFAFRRGFVIFLWSIVWGIAAGVIALVISGGAILAMVMNPLAFVGPAAAGPALMMVAGIIVGALVASIGNYATIVKITLESVEETTKIVEQPAKRPMEF